MCIFCLRADLCPDAAEKIRDSARRSGNINRALAAVFVRSFPDGCDRRISGSAVFRHGGLRLLSASGAEKTEGRDLR